MSLSALLRACRVPGSCHAQFRTEGTVDLPATEVDEKDVSAPLAPSAQSSDASAPTATPAATQTLPTTSSPAQPPPETDSTPSDVLHTAPSSSEILHPSASIDFGVGVEMPDASGMWCPLADARVVAEERLRPYLPESVRREFLADVVVLREVEETKMDLEDSKMDVEDSETKTREEDSSRDETPSATAPTTDEPILEKALAASEEDISVFVRPSSPATVPCATRRVLRTRPARVARTRARP